MTHPTEKIDSQIERLNKEVEKMTGLEVFSIGLNDSAEDLKQSFLNVKGEPFYIAVCGIVKAGKSTFLNNWLFQQEVLPVSSTPCTAKLTFIRHTEKKNYFKVEFYAKDTYKEMCRKLSQKAREIHDKRVEKAAEKGVFLEELAGTTTEGSGENNFEKLKDYVAEDGKFVPFVDRVTLYINRPELKKVVIVDTPGLDDPNPLNSEVTEAWAKKADAVIYLMPWRGMSMLDKEFIEKNFGKMANAEKWEAKTNRTFVLTQIDTNPEWQQSMKDFRLKFPAEKNNIFGCSAQLELLQAKHDRGEGLTEDEEWTLSKWSEQLENSGFDPGKLSEAIAKKLCENTDVKNKLNRFRTRIINCYMEAISLLNGEIEKANSRIHIFECEKTDAEKQGKKLHNVEKKFSDDLDEIVKKATEPLAKVGKCFSASAEIRKEMNAAWSRYFDGRQPSLTELREVMPRRARELMRTIGRGGVASNLSKLFDDTKDALSYLSSKSNQLIQDQGCEESISIPPIWELKDGVERLMTEIYDKKVDDMGLGDVTEKTSIWWFNAQENRTKVRTMFEDLSASEWKDVAEDCYATCERKCREAIKEYASRIKKRIQDANDDLKKCLEMTENEKKEKGEEEKKRLAELKNKLQAIESAKEDFRIHN